MEHSYFEDRLSAFHDRSLPVEEMELLTQHVADCSECRAELEQYQKLDRLVADNSDLDGEEYWEKSAARIEKAVSEPEVINVRQSSWSGLGWKIATVAASFAILGYIALYQTDILDRWERDRDKPVLEKTVPSPESTIMYAPTIPPRDTVTVGGELPPVVDSTLGPADLIGDVIYGGDKVESSGAGEETKKEGVGIPKPAMITPTPVKKSPQIKSAAETEENEAVPLEVMLESEGRDQSIPGADQPGVEQFPVDSGTMSKTRRAIGATQGFVAGESDSLSVEESPSARAQVSPDSLERQLDQLQPPQYELSNLSGKGLGIVSIGQISDSLSLDGWRAIRDAKIAELKKPAVRKMAAAKPKQTATDESSADRGPTTKDMLKLELLEASYNICLTTENDDEYDECYRDIADCADDFGFFYEEKAREYLKLLNNAK